MTQPRTLIAIVNGVMWQLDPLGKYPHADRFAIAEACGILPTFVHRDDDQPAQEQMKANYRFFLGWMDMKGSTFDNDGLGSYTYPEDPVQFPYATGKLNDQLIHIYPSAFVQVHNTETGERFFTRMD